MAIAPRSPLPAPRCLDWAPSGALRILDQTLLPHDERWLELDRVETVVEAIRTLRVRGAPAIGVAAAMGLVASLLRAARLPRERFLQLVDRACEDLASARPTAVNLTWAMQRMHAVAHETEGSAAAVFEALHTEAEAIRAEDEAMCRAIAEHGQGVIEACGRKGRKGSEGSEGGSEGSEPVRVLTHCNTGALATAGIGTALGIVYLAHERGVPLHVWVDETRPLLQGSRLTAWELGKAGIPHTLLPDSAAATLLQQGRVDVVLVGADRIAANGDTANKVGTLPLAIAAQRFGVPCYVVAPTSTFDLDSPDGAAIPIEQRGSAEVTRPFGQRVAPEGTAVFNPAFDVTPAGLISGWVTERGVLRPPF
jgi:methylthioribose-1-phosphate isomerase